MLNKRGENIIMEKEQEPDKPISMWGYWGYRLLFCIPIIGTIFLIVFCFAARNKNLKNYARSYFCFAILIIFIVIIAGVRLGMFEEIFGIGNNGIYSSHIYNQGKYNTISNSYDYSQEVENSLNEQEKHNSHSYDMYSNITINNYERSQETENYFIEQGEKNYNELFSAANFTNNNEENLEIITDAD